jgi:hypothetical protein
MLFYSSALAVFSCALFVRVFVFVSGVFFVCVRAPRLVALCVWYLFLLCLMRLKKEVFIMLNSGKIKLNTIE